MIRRIVRAVVPPPIRRVLRNLEPARALRRTIYRKWGTRWVGVYGLRFLRENEKIYPYQPLHAPGLDAVAPLPDTERGCEDRWEVICKRLHPPGVFLDVGSQHGYFVLRAAEMGYTALGIERNKTSHRVAEMLRLANDMDRAAFLALDVTNDTLPLIPQADVVTCLSVFHHWVREHDLAYATRIMQSLANRCNSTFFFETGQPNETDAWWAPELEFMNPDPKAWIEDYLRSLGFKDVDCMGKFAADHISPTPRYLFMAKK